LSVFLTSLLCCIFQNIQNEWNCCAEVPLTIYSPTR